VICAHAPPPAFEAPASTGRLLMFHLLKKMHRAKYMVSRVLFIQFRELFSILSLLPPPARTRISQILSKCNLPKYQPSSFRQSKMYKTFYKRQNVKLISKRLQTPNQWATNINRAPELHYCCYQVPNKGTCQNSAQN
jgi:hypothetical protein